jgi:membrane protease YdiL (CAAX protease family)
VFGGVSFLVFAVVAYVILLTSGGYPSPNGRTLLLVLLWAFANSIVEELWFRAVFLEAYQRVIGRTAAILVTSAVFGASHVFATYGFPGGPIVFGIVVFALGAVGAYSMSKTESLIGAVRFHAGYDLTIILPVLASA